MRRVKLSSKELRQKVWKKTGGVCAHCGKIIYGQKTVDHVIPKSMGGSYTIANLMPLCLLRGSVRCFNRYGGRSVMRYENFSMKEHGFVGHLAEPDAGSDRAVIVIMGGEQSILPGIKFAERFAVYGITGLAVSLFGAEGLPDAPDRVPLDMFIPAVEYLRSRKGIEHISVYGQSMGSIFAVLVAQYIGGMENLIMVSPTHVPFEGTAKDRKTMTGRSVATFKTEDIPFVSADFTKIKATKYYKHRDAEYKVLGMWIAYHDAYEDREKAHKAMLHVEKSESRVLLIAGHEDEAWPAEYSVREIEKNLKS
nr:HNH endonuclease [Lachnospiraceae bacterium]